jgi:hypothetical protein
MKISTKRTLTGAEAVVFIGLFITVVGLLSLWTERNLEFWFTYFKGVPVEVHYGLAFLLTLMLNGFMFALNIFFEILRLAV